MTLLSNLNQEEIQHLYELFFGPILVKHQNFSYLDKIKYYYRHAAVFD